MNEINKKIIYLRADFSSLLLIASKSRLNSSCAIEIIIYGYILILTFSVLN